MEEIIFIERLLIAAFVGGLVGYEREYKNSHAGLRTHILVCLGAAVVTLISEYNLDKYLLLAENPIYANVITVDSSRLGAQVISGVGFLGAGTILREKGSIKGLTTAASLWIVACLGLAVGQGLYGLAITAAIIVVITLSLLRKLDNFIYISSSRVKDNKKRSL
ncbi:MgtC/SapB family protein [Clostridium sp. AL.422]|uniref:MgtC/SapB family protein n=1 Tax=Clostridium TaxID=1485 RepID=UPI00293DFE7E|nr:MULTISPECIES: MgtC/SapB family protein [unclassified Clostridium]MDV4151381.1 MgtC/SapB family protein [Clostridium sp. AL.422]